MLCVCLSCTVSKTCFVFAFLALCLKHALCLPFLHCVYNMLCVCLSLHRVRNMLYVAFICIVPETCFAFAFLCTVSEICFVLPFSCTDQVNSSLRSAVTKTQQLIPPGSNFMLVNGLSVDIDDFDLYGEIQGLVACVWPVRWL